MGDLAMAIMHSRRRFVTQAAVAGAAGLGALSAVGLGGGGKSFAAEPPPEISTIRLSKAPITCLAPQFVAEQLLHAEGFTDVRYEALDRPPVQKLARDELDLAMDFAPSTIMELDGGLPVTIVAGVHVGCFELFAHEHIRSISDLKGRTVGAASLGYETERHLVSIMASYVGPRPT
jgi:NitT/TauT family transport system substrate-binding protein